MIYSYSQIFVEGILKGWNLTGHTVLSSTFHANWVEGGGNTDCPTDYTSWLYPNGEQWFFTSEIVMECQTERKSKYG